MAIYRDRPKRNVTLPATVTTPNLTLSIAQVIERSAAGIEMQGYTPVYLGKKFDYMANFENMTKQEQLEFYNQLKKRAENDIKQVTAAMQEEKRRYDEEVANALKIAAEQKLNINQTSQNP
jgi:cell division protein FtsX